MGKKQIDLSVVIPVYNEEKVISVFYDKVSVFLKKLSINYELIFVDDGSSDSTYDRIRQIAQNDQNVIGIKFSKNFGHQSALLAGIKEACGNYVLMMDGDLQHPPELIPELWKTALEGYDIVNTVRIQDNTINCFKKITSNLFYRLFSYLSGIKINRNLADFRIISKKVRHEILKMGERALFLRGIFMWVGFSSKFIHYNPGKREFGESKYNFKKMLSLAINGITSFSIMPLRLSLVLCLVSFSFAIFYILFAFFQNLVGNTIPGWTSILILMSLFFSGVFIILGIIGEYLAKIYIEVKQRPHYIIEAKCQKTS